jgi:pilus assembly protein Flp/PilA
MRRHCYWLKRLIQCEEGPTAVEYAVMLALILLVCLVAIRSFGTTTSESIRNSANSIAS